MKKAVLYINQFFAGIGGEEKADHAPEIREGVMGPGLALKASLKNAEITHTIICGDNFMGSNTEEAIEIIGGFLEIKMFKLSQVYLDSKPVINLFGRFLIHLLPLYCPSTRLK